MNRYTYKYPDILSKGDHLNELAVFFFCRFLKLFLKEEELVLKKRFPDKVAFFGWHEMHTELGDFP